jgi:adenylate kinase family enzyme
MNQKIIITGATCSGKTTLGKKLSDQLAMIQVDLDAYHFLPNWVEKEKSVFVNDVLNAIEGKERWIVTGSYQSILKDTVWQQADTIILLDYPLYVILRRYFARTYRRVVYKEKCCGENYETLGRTFSKNSLFLWIFKSYWRKKKRMKKWMSEDFSAKEWIVLKHPRNATKFLAQV